MRLRALALSAALVTSVHAQSLCEQLHTFVTDPAAASAHWGVSLTRLDGTILCGINDGQLFRPASNNKIFTTAAALALLGSRHTFATRVAGRLDTANGTVQGDLTLIGGGDANLDSNDLPYLPPTQRTRTPAGFAFHDLDDLAMQLVAKGVTAVTGDLIGDDTLFPNDPYPPSWNADDLTWGYGAPVSALTIADNQLRMTITAGRAAGEPASVTLDQHDVDFYSLQPEVRTLSGKTSGGIGVERLPGSRVLRVYGSIAQDAPPDHEEIAIADPAMYAALAFRQVLAAHGIQVAGTTRSRHRPLSEGSAFSDQLQRATTSAQAALSLASAPAFCLPGVSGDVLATHSSAPLLADLTLTNKISQNLHAELLLRGLSVRNDCKDGSNAGGAGTVRAYLLKAGVAPEDFLLYDGSGLSDHDLVAPRALTKFLGYAATQSWFADWKKTLPEGGVDGTLNARFPALQGRIFAKTGTLGESRALSGYVVTAAGETLVFSVLVDTHLPGSADRVIMDRIVSTIVQSH